MLLDWWLTKVKVEVPNALFKLGVAGYASFGRSVVYFSSTEIVSRHIGGTLETTDGITITLFGLINRSRAHENGFPFQVCCSLFAFGFPFDWEQIGYQYFRGESVDRGRPSNVTSVSNGDANSSPGLSFKETRFFNHMMLSSGDYNECTQWQIRSLFDDILSEYGSLVKLNEKDGHQIITDDSLLTECGGTPLNASKKNNRSGVAKSSTSEEAKKFGKDALSNMSTIKKRKANC